MNRINFQDWSEVHKARLESAQLVPKRGLYTVVCRFHAKRFKDLVNLQVVMSHCTSKSIRFALNIICVDRLTMLMISSTFLL